MDGKFRLAFAKPGETPSAAAYVGKDALTFDRLREAVKAGHERNSIWEAPFISHKFIVLDPFTIGLLYNEFVGTS